jgi:WD40 repeat protein
LICQFKHNLLFHPKWGGISQGGRYLAMEETDSDGFRLLVWDLTTGQMAGKVEFQPKSEPWGQACGVSFSPDGREVAVLWRLNEANRWARLYCFDMTTGRRVCDYTIHRPLEMVETMWSRGGAACLSWLPDGRGWLLFGCVMIDRQTGNEMGRVPPEPKNEGEFFERRFIGRDHLTTIQGGFDKKLTIQKVGR